MPKLVPSDASRDGTSDIGITRVPETQWLN
jgi:hypothetical protein